MKVPSPPAELRHLAAELAEAKPMRRGSLSERMVKCSKPGCPCADNPEARHGPYFSLTRAVEGKTHSRFLTPEQAALARRQIDAGHQFRAKIEALWQGCEAWADSQLQGSTAASMAKAEKGGSKRTSKRRSSRKSRRS
jgi:hypothetical protein